MNLTTDQLKALVSDEAVPVVIDDTECVVIRRDVYERTQMLMYDDSPLTPEEQEAAFLDAGKLAG